MWLTSIINKILSLCLPDPGKPNPSHYTPTVLTNHSTVGVRDCPVTNEITDREANILCHEPADPRLRAMMLLLIMEKEIESVNNMIKDHSHRIYEKRWDMTEEGYSELVHQMDKYKTELRGLTRQYKKHKAAFHAK